jgi:hypothetical protein
MCDSQPASADEAIAAVTAGLTYLARTDAAALACDATIFPVITGTLDNAALDTLVGLFLNAFTHGQHTSTSPAPGNSTDRDSGSEGRDTGAAAGTSGQAEADPGLPEGFQSPELPRQTLLALATDILSGPGGLASLLRTAPGMPFPTISLPLDTGTGSETSPGHPRRLVIPRGNHCRFPGCWRQPAACHVHHLTHREDGGPTSLANCHLVCRFHHPIAIHRWGWKLTANADGTTTATHPNGRVPHSHPPPSQAA